MHGAAAALSLIVTSSQPLLPPHYVPSTVLIHLDMLHMLNIFTDCNNFVEYKK